MAINYEHEDSLIEEISNGALLNELAQFLNEARHYTKLQNEMLRMDQQVAEVITPEEYCSYNIYKQHCLKELATLSQMQEASGAMRAAIERGYILGYWFALQREKLQGN